ncbi:MAG TPA: BTAD domain-containing putative transcriptional regulator, partial [Caldilineaceae bacterium]|nr:BTAD domain-containing putative transcriptional regulator [Caldilineaceae bacterium]
MSRVAPVPKPAMLHIYLFGSFRLSYGGEPLRFASLPRTLPLWAYLLLNPNPVGRDQLAGLFWPEVSETEARSNLRRHLHDLRRALPSPPPDQPWLLTEQETIQWNLAAAAWLDVTVFEQSAADINRLAEAVMLYAGDLLPNVYEDWIFFHRERLRVRFFDVLVALMQQAHERRDFAQAIRYAQQILQHDPIREDVVRQLMTLRHLSGDRAGALREYQQFAQRLREELDVPPMLETSALYDSIAQQSMAVVARGDRQTPALPATPAIPAPLGPVADSHAAPNNLPAQLTTFIGREAELAAIQQWLLGPGETTRLLTLTGPGGSGKTRLALEAGARLARLAAPRYPGGVFVVWLATVTDPNLVIPTLANTLSVSESVGKSLLETLQDYLRHRRILLILDNLEHLTASARQLAALLTAAPGVQMVVTSRALLRLYGEQEFGVPSLSLPPSSEQVRPEEATQYAALALFVARSRAVNPNFVL